MEKQRCFNCKEIVNAEYLMKVRQKGKVRQWCDACFDGYNIVKSFPNKRGG